VIRSKITDTDKEAGFFGISERPKPYTRMFVIQRYRNLPLKKNTGKKCGKTALEISLILAI